MGTPPPGLLSWQPCSLTPPPLSRSSEESPTRACPEKKSPLSACLEKSLSRASAKRNPNGRQLRMDGAGLTVVQRPSVCKLNGLNNHVRHHHSQRERSSSDRTEEVVGTYECRQLQSLQSNPLTNPSTKWNGNALPHLVLHRKLHRHPAVVCSAAAAAAGGDGAIFSSDLGTDTAGDGAIFSSDLSSTTNGGAYESRGKFFAHYQNHQMDCFAEWIVIVVGFKSVQEYYSKPTYGFFAESQSLFSDSSALIASGIIDFPMEFFQGRRIGYSCKNNHMLMDPLPQLVCCAKSPHSLHKCVMCSEGCG